MPQWLRNIIARIRGIHAVDNVIADFAKVRAKLEAAAEHHDIITNLRDEAARLAIEARNKAADEADRARTLAKRFEELLGK